MKERQKVASSQPASTPFMSSAFPANKLALKSESCSIVSDSLRPH